MVYLKEIKFGIELETVGSTREAVAKVIQLVVGGEVRYVGTPACYDPWEIRDSKDRVWRVVADASLTDVPVEYRAEIVSPVLEYTDIPEIQEVVRSVRRIGSRASKTCGIHVHLSHPNITPKALANLAKMIYKQEAIIYTALGVTPERMKKYCKPIDPAFIERITKNTPTSFRQLNTQWYGVYEAHPQRYHSSRYSILNLNAWFVRSAIEIRAYSGSLHAGKVRAALLFSMALLAKAMNTRGASARKREYNPASGKYDMRVFLISSLKMNGPEYKNCRMHLLNLLSGDSAWKHGRPIGKGKLTETKTVEAHCG